MRREIISIFDIGHRPATHGRKHPRVEFKVTAHYSGWESPICMMDVDDAKEFVRRMYAAIKAAEEGDE